MAVVDAQVKLGKTKKLIHKLTTDIIDQKSLYNLLLEELEEKAKERTEESEV